MKKPRPDDVMRHATQASVLLQSFGGSLQQRTASEDGRCRQPRHDDSTSYMCISCYKNVLHTLFETHSFQIQFFVHL